MQLALKITSFQRLTPGQLEVFRPESDSFTIGRSNENDWTLADPNLFLSGSHCRIFNEGGKFFLTDTSTNGVFLNGADQRLVRNQSVPLNDGDRFRMGDYEIKVIIEDPMLAGDPSISGDATLVGALDFDDPFADPAAPPVTADNNFHEDLNTPLSHMDNASLGASVSLDSLMGFDEGGDKAEEEPSAEHLEQQYSPLREAFSPSRQSNPGSTANAPRAPTPDQPSPTQGSGEIPENWDEGTGMFIIPATPGASVSPGDDFDFPDDWDQTTGRRKIPHPPAPVEAPPPTPQPPQSAPPLSQQPQTPAAPPSRPATQPARASSPAGGAVAAFARGANLDVSGLTAIDEQVFFEQIGKMMLQFTEGLITALAGRVEIKSEFRIEQTMIRPVDNNPFKFSTSKAGTLMQLVSRKDTAFQSGTGAIMEGFDDINAHQVAVIAGMEAAVQGILERFNPKTLENRITSDSVLDNLLPGGKKAKYWEVFKLLFDEIAGEAEDNSQRLFGREFARAYEEQLSRLKNRRKE